MGKDPLNRFNEIMRKKKRDFEEILDGREIDHSLVFQIETKIDRADNEIHDLLQEHRNRYFQSQEIIDKLRQELVEKDAEVMGLKRQVRGPAELQKRLQEAKEQMANVDRKNREFEDREMLLSARRQALEERAKTLESHQGERKGLLQIIKTLEGKVKSLEGKRGDMTVKRETLRGLQGRLAEERVKRINSALQIEDIEYQIEVAKIQKEQHEHLSGQLRVAESERDAVQDSIAQMEAKLKDDARKLDEDQELIEEWKREALIAQRNLEDAKSREMALKAKLDQALPDLQEAKRAHASDRNLLEEEKQDIYLERQDMKRQKEILSQTQSKLTQVAAFAEQEKMELKFLKEKNEEARVRQAQLEGTIERMVHDKNSIMAKLERITNEKRDMEMKFVIVDNKQTNLLEMKDREIGILGQEILKLQRTIEVMKNDHQLKLKELLSGVKAQLSGQVPSFMNAPGGSFDALNRNGLISQMEKQLVDQMMQGGEPYLTPAMGNVDPLLPHDPETNQVLTRMHNRLSTMENQLHEMSESKKHMKKKQKMKKKFGTRSRREFFG